VAGAAWIRIPVGVGHSALKVRPFLTRCVIRGFFVRILVIKDNSKLAEMMRQGLTKQGYAVDVSQTAGEGGHLAATGTYDAIILDVMLPDYDGVQVCRELRGKGVKTPLLMLTVLSSTGDKVRGLDAGADDYLTKPFDFDELVARVRSLLRRGQASESTLLKYDDLELDLVRRIVSRGGRRINLTQKEFALLELFLRSPNRVLTRTAIGMRVWDMNFESESNVIDVYVHTLRRKLEQGCSKPLIHTVVGAGYMLGPDSGST